VSFQPEKTSGAGGAGAGTEIPDALFFGALDVALAAVSPVAALAARVRILFFTIFEGIEGISKNNGGDATVLRKKDRQGRGTVKRENGRDKFCPPRL
jgi:hypothetical protein